MAVEADLEHDAMKHGAPRGAARDASAATDGHAPTGDWRAAALRGFRALLRVACGVVSVLLAVVAVFLATISFSGEAADGTGIFAFLVLALPLAAAAVWLGWIAVRGIPVPPPPLPDQRFAALADPTRKLADLLAEPPRDGGDARPRAFR